MADKAYYSERFKALLFGQPVLYQLAVVMHPGVKTRAEEIQPVRQGPAQRGRLAKDYSVITGLLD